MNGLNPVSEDEAITIGILLKESIRSIIVVGDSKNLQRTLNLTLQLSLLQIPLVLVLNMTDETKRLGISINSELLSNLIGIPVLSTIATKEEGLSNILKEKPKKSKIEINFPKFIEEIFEKASEIIPEHKTWDKKGLILQLLRKDPVTWAWFEKFASESSVLKLKDMISEINSKYHLGIDYTVINIIDRYSKQISQKVTSRIKTDNSNLRIRLDSITLNPITGIPLLIIVMVVIFLLVGYIGAGLLVDFIEVEIFNGIINPGIIFLTDTIIPWQIVRDFLSGEFGIFTLGLTYAFGVILPIVAVFFLIFSFLEDTGYLPRIAVLLNSTFNRVGLNGKAVLPLLLGTGCVTMATLSTRILESKKERLIATTILALGIPCSAQLGVILGIVSSISVVSMLIIVLVIISQILIVAYLMNKIIPGKRSDFLLELPPLRSPQFSNVIFKTLARIESFIKEAVPIFIVGIFFINILNILGIIDLIINSFEPVVETFLGLPKETSLTFIFGFIRRDFGAAGLFELVQMNLLSVNQIVVLSIVLILFIPCLATFLIIAKEYGQKTAFSVLFFILPYALLIGTLVNYFLIIFGIELV